MLNSPWSIATPERIWTSLASAVPVCAAWGILSYSFQRFLTAQINGHGEAKCAHRQLILCKFRLQAACQHWPIYSCCLGVFSVLIFVVTGPLVAIWDGDRSMILKGRPIPIEIDFLILLGPRRTPAALPVVRG